MVFSTSLKELNQEYVTNHVRKRKVRDNYLLTTEAGTWVILTPEEFKSFETGKIDESDNLFKTLSEKFMILHPHNKEDYVAAYKKRFDHFYQGTSLHIIVPTLRCNLNCVYCHASSANCKTSEYDMDEATAKKTVDFIFQSPSPSISIEFQGGEPTLNLGIVKFIVKYAEELNRKFQKNLKFVLVSNLSHVSEDFVNFCIEHKIHLSTSLDGHQPIHDKNRSMSHDRVIKNLKHIRKRMKEAGTEIEVNALLTVTRDALKYPKEIVDEYISIGMKNIFIRHLNRLGMAQKDWDELGYSAEEFITFWKQCMDYIIENDLDIFPYEVFIIVLKILGEEDPNYLDMRSPCGAVIGQLLYNYDGTIYSCDEARMVGEDLFKLGTVNQSFKTVVSCNKSCALISSSVNDNFVCDDCAYKPYCGICPVCNYAEFGSVIANIAETRKCKISLAQFDYIFDKLINDKRFLNKVKDLMDRKRDILITGEY